MTELTPEDRQRIEDHEDLHPREFAKQFPDAAARLAADLDAAWERLKAEADEIDAFLQSIGDPDDVQAGDWQDLLADARQVKAILAKYGARAYIPPLERKRPGRHSQYLDYARRVAQGEDFDQVLKDCIFETLAKDAILAHEKERCRKGIKRAIEALRKI